MNPTWLISELFEFLTRIVVRWLFEGVHAAPARRVMQTVRHLKMEES